MTRNDPSLQQELKSFEHGDRKIELVFIGIGLNKEELEESLDRCLLQPDELNFWKKNNKRKLSTVSD
ncbi:GTP-binding protein [Alteribacillus sp. HJP-4]|uniref:GTP-binding protein n=1 Tax=Alteribacillus sp. HJP-4 TaxID=2775394 RepID=UPI0035CCDFCB